MKVLPTSAEDLYSVVATKAVLNWGKRMDWQAAFVVIPLLAQVYILSIGLRDASFWLSIDRYNDTTAPSTELIGRAEVFSLILLSLCGLISYAMFIIARHRLSALRAAMVIQIIALSTLTISLGGLSIVLEHSWWLNEMSAPALLIAVWVSLGVPLLRGSHIELRERECWLICHSCLLAVSCWRLYSLTIGNVVDIIN